MTRISQEQPPSDTNTRLKEWLARLVININGALSRLSESGVMSVSLSAKDYTTQVPAGVGSTIQIKFGAAQDNDDVSIAADGSITIKRSASYMIKAKLAVSRTGVAGTAVNIFRMLVNGSPLGSPVYLITRVDNEVAFMEAEESASLKAGDVVTIEYLLDAAGVADGSVQPLTSTTGWPQQPSAEIKITRTSEVLVR